MLRSPRLRPTTQLTALRVTHAAVAQTAPDDTADSFEGDACCGGICLTAALCASQHAEVTAVQAARFALSYRTMASAEATSQLRPPRA
jgi:hypothetical protein